MFKAAGAARTTGWKAEIEHAFIKHARACCLFMLNESKAVLEMLAKVSVSRGSRARAFTRLPLHVANT